MEADTNVLTPTLGNIREEWHWVREGLVEIQDDIPPIDELPEDVYVACVTGQAHLWVHPDYFVITKFVVEDNIPCLLIWKSWSREKGNKSSLGWHSFFENLAAENKCSHLAINTPHRRLAEYCVNEFDYTVRSYILTKQVD